MIIFKDIISGDEILSDSYKLKDIDGIVYEADCDMITIDAVQVNTGANTSAEGGDEDGTEDAAVKVNNIVHSFQLQSTSFDKKSYLSHIKGYMKAVKEQLKANGTSEEEITKFEKGAQAQVKKIVGNFKDYDFYVGEKMNPDGMTVLMNYREDGVTPYVTVWKHGLKGMKV